MSNLVVRYNFETNSSSMHSLSIRKTSGAYSIDELMHSEAMNTDSRCDAIITLKDGHVITEKEARADGWIWDDKMSIWYHDLELKNSAMQVLSSFRDKIVYAMATVYGYRYRGWKDRIEEIKAIFKKHLPNVELNMHRIDSYDLRYRSIGTNQYMLFQFLKQNRITLEEFLTNTKYLVIVDYAEYEKMKWLNMVKEDKIANVYYTAMNIAKTINIENGVWKLSECDISFGRSPFRVLGTPEGKARYALASSHSANIDNILNIMQEIYPEMKAIELPADEYSPDGVCYGYCEDSAIPDNVPLREFILNKKYVIISDGDEYCVWDSFKNTPLFNNEEYPNGLIEEDE